jgi:hypothetical protein
MAAMKSVDENTIDPNLIQNYNLIEYKKGDQLIGISWDASLTTNENDILTNLNASLDCFC